MRLIELEPRWLTPDLFVFRNPLGGPHLITCKRAPMSRRDQMSLLQESFPPDVAQWVIPTTPEFAWQFEGNDFATLTVTPSINAGGARGWHGYITNGEVA